MRTSRRRTLAALLVGTGLLGSSVLALSAAALDPPPPVGLLPALSAVTNGPVCDALDESPDYADVDCDAAGASAYFGADATTLAAAVVLEQSPLVAKGAQSPMQSTTYVVQLGVAGVHRASFGVDGKGTNDRDVLHAGCAGASVPTIAVPASAALAAGWSWCPTGSAGG